MKKLLPLGLVSVALSAIIGCSEPQASAQAQTPPPPPIDVASVNQMEITDWYTFTTRLQAPEIVNLRPRVSGIIDEVNFIEGSIVTEGDPLFVLDLRSFEAEVTSLEAQLTRAKAALQQAKSEFDRAKSLSQTSAISAEETEARRATFAQRQADVSSISASLNIAKLNLDFATIKAPISGRISKANITKGNTVRVNDTVLTSIVATDNMYAYFDIDERTWNSKFAQLSKVQGLPVRLELLGHKEAATFGTLDFVDNAINPNTGTLTVRARFPNEDNQLTPGSFARVSIAPSEFELQVLVPDRAIGTDLKNKFILTLNEDNTIAYTPVKTGKRIGEFRIIESGLEAGAKILVNGPAKVGPGMTITPREVELELPKSLLVSEFKKQLNKNTAGQSQNVMGAK